MSGRADLGQQARRPPAGRAWRLGAVGVSLASHGALFAALILGWKYPAGPIQLNPIAVSLLEAPLPPPRPYHLVQTPHVAQARAAPATKPQAQKSSVRPSPAPPVPESLAAAPANAPAAAPGLSDADLAGAETADSGPPGRECNMVRRLQSALRKDPLVQAAVAQAHGPGKAIMVWNGDWVESDGEDGKGLAAVREAIVWEVAFAPAACRAEPVRGLILLSLNEGASSMRLAVGQGQWRWSDLLGAAAYARR